MNFSARTFQIISGEVNKRNSFNERKRTDLSQDCNEEPFPRNNNFNPKQSKKYIIYTWWWSGLTVVENHPKKSHIWIFRFYFSSVCMPIFEIFEFSRQKLPKIHVGSWRENSNKWDFLKKFSNIVISGLAYFVVLLSIW